MPDILQTAAARIAIQSAADRIRDAIEMAFFDNGMPISEIAKSAGMPVIVIKELLATTTLDIP